MNSDGGQERHFILKGVSMNPVLKTGDLLELLPVSRQEVRKGDILAFTNAEGHNIIHRVIRLHPLQTKGDNCVNTDAPVPEASTLYRAVSFMRRGKLHKLTWGWAGRLQFRWNRCRRFVLLMASNLLLRLARRNPFRIPASRLTVAVFPNRTVYYAGKHPVGWMDQEGWHWLGWAQFYVQQPKSTGRI